MRENPQDFIKLSEEVFSDYEINLDLETSIRLLWNRLYYSAFYAAKAILLADLQRKREEMDYQISVQESREEAQWFGTKTKSFIDQMKKLLG